MKYIVFLTIAYVSCAYTLLSVLGLVIAFAGWDLTILTNMVDDLTWFGFRIVMIVCLVIAIVTHLLDSNN